MGGDETPIASLSLSIPMSRLTPESEAGYGETASEAARDLSAPIGYTSAHPE
ncbi:hypothetical protein GCM10027097_11030 [Amycolatopsis acidiphila]